MRIAVVGGGISGLAASLALASENDVTLYEKQEKLGGHANTVHIQRDGKKVAVDTGFMVFNPHRYPTFVSMMEYLGIESVPTTMSFSVCIPGVIEFASHGIGGLFADRRTIVKPSHYFFLKEILRFDRLARNAISLQISAETTLADFLSQHNFSGAVIDRYLYPMLAAIWSCPSKRVDDFPALATFRFLDNHRLLEPLAKSTWRTIPGGSERYVQALESKLREENVRIVCNAAISSIVRTEGTVTISTSTGAESYDHLVLAAHADSALALLTDPTEDERAILGAFTYSKNKAVLHGDTGLMPERKAAWASWNYRSASNDESERLVVTYNMNYLQHIDASIPVYVSLNPPQDIAREMTYAVIEYTHPHFNLAALRAQEKLPIIQGKNRTLFAGAHWGYGFHEDGARSGIEAAAILGSTPPWQK